MGSGIGAWRGWYETLNREAEDRGWTVQDQPHAHNIVMSSLPA